MEKALDVENRHNTVYTDVKRMGINLPARVWKAIQEELNKNGYEITKKKKKKQSYIYAYDSKIKRRFIHVLKGNKAISLVTGHTFTLTKKEMKELEKDRKKKRR